MKKYKVIPMYVSGTKKRIFTSGDIVTEEDFPGNADELERKGYLQKIGEDDKVARIEDAEPEFIEHKETSVDDVSVARMKKDLTKAGVQFEKDISKVDLFELWSKLPKK